MYTAILVLSSTVDQTVCTVLVQLGTGEAPKLDLRHAPRMPLRLDVVVEDLLSGSTRRVA